MQAVRQDRFEPRRYQGKPAPAAVTVDLNFCAYSEK
jgi:hypothetical protein